MRLRDHLVDGAVREQLAIGDIGDLVTALGLVHVMGRDEHGQAVGGERMDLVPESRRAFGSTPAVGSSSSSSCGSDSVQAPSASRCFQPPDKRAGELLSRPARPSRSIMARARRARLRQPVDARDEFEVLAHRQVVHRG